MNAARNIVDDQISETPMEARIARIESDVEHIKDVLSDIKLDVRGMQGELKAANDSIAALQKDVGVINATLPHLATKADLREVEGAMNAQVKTVEGELKAQIKSVEGSLNGGIVSVEGSLNAKIESVEGRLNAKIESFEGKLSAKIESVEGKISAMETRIIKWFIFTALAIGSLAFSIARFIR